VEECSAIKSSELKLEHEIKRLRIRLDDRLNGVIQNSNAIASRRLSAGPTSAHDADVRSMKRKTIMLQKRVQSAEQERDQMMENVQLLEMEKHETTRILEMAELSYQMLESKNERLQEEIEFYKSELKLQADHFSSGTEEMTKTIETLRPLEVKNVELTEQIKELKSQLEREKSDKVTVIQDLKSKITSLESDKGSQVDRITTIMTNLQSSSTGEMSNLRVELTTKNKKIEALEAELADYREKSLILANELNRICDEVERSEQLYHRIEHLTRENENLRQDVNFLQNDNQALKQELLTKEKEVATFIDDNDKLVAKLVTLGFQVQVDEKTAQLLFVPIQPQVQSKVSLKESLVGLSIDELLNGD